MSGKSGKSNGRGRRGRNERSGRGRGKGHGYTGTSKKQKSGLCKALESNVFDYGHKAAADQMRTSYEKLIQYVGTTYGQDISDELHNKTFPTLLPNQGPRLQQSRVRATGKRNDFKAAATHLL
jgi:hypothetical protein